MKKTFFLLIVCCAFSTTILAQQETAKASLSLEKNAHDFGDLLQGSEAVYEFKFKNTGNASLLITEVKAFCSCTSAEWSKEPIEAGKSGVVKVFYDTKRRMGAFNKALHIISNAENSPSAVIVKGNVIPVQQK